MARAALSSESDSGATDCTLTPSSPSSRWRAELRCSKAHVHHLIAGKVPRRAAPALPMAGPPSA